MVLSFAAACGGNDQPSGSQGGQATQPAANGTRYEATRFSIIVPDGWEVMDVDGGVQLYKSSGEIFEVHYRGNNMNESEAQSQVESTANNYDGTEPQQATMLGKTFWSTTFTASGVEQVTNLCIENGEMLSIKYGGPGYDTNPDFQTILNSIEFAQ